MLTRLLSLVNEPVVKRIGPEECSKRLLIRPLIARPVINLYRNGRITTNRQVTKVANHHEMFSQGCY